MSRLAMSMPMTTIQDSVSVCDELVDRVKRVMRNQRMVTEIRAAKVSIE